MAPESNLLIQYNIYLTRPFKIHIALTSLNSFQLELILRPMSIEFKIVSYTDIPLTILNSLIYTIK